MPVVAVKGMNMPDDSSVNKSNQFLVLKGLARHAEGQE